MLGKDLPPICFRVASWVPQNGFIGRTPELRTPFKLMSGGQGALGLAGLHHQYVRIGFSERRGINRNLAVDCSASATGVELMSGGQGALGSRSFTVTAGLNT